MRGATSHCPSGPARQEPPSALTSGRLGRKSAACGALSGMPSRCNRPLTESAKLRPPRNKRGDLRRVACAARPYRDVQILALRLERRTCEGHPVFPAVKASDSEPIKCERVQSSAVTGRPHQPLLVGRLQLPVDVADVALIINCYQTAEDAVTPFVVALNTADHDPDARGARMRDSSPPVWMPPIRRRRSAARCFWATRHSLPASPEKPNRHRAAYPEHNAPGNHSKQSNENPKTVTPPFGQRMRWASIP